VAKTLSNQVLKINEKAPPFKLKGMHLERLARPTYSYLIIRRGYYSMEE
jgi:hypothetical protein